MGKFIPHQGRITHPGKSYYDYNIKHRIFRVVNASNEAQTICITEEHVFGDKNRDRIAHSSPATFLPCALRNLCFSTLQQAQSSRYAEN